MRQNSNHQGPFRAISQSLFVAVFLIVGLALVASCGGEKLKPFVSFYYWKATYKLNQTERDALLHNDVQQIYLRYFDIVYDETLKAARPEQPLRMDTSDILKPIIPVVYIKNQVFASLDSLDLDTLADRTLDMLNKMNQLAGIKCRGLQFDCDWTSKTSKQYFYFLKRMRKIMDAHEHGTTFSSLAMLTATIRLHQVKYHDREGVPPVDKGVLMFYNMAKIDTSQTNSIYDLATSKQYINSLSAYPLRLDLALPIFAWGIQIREGSVVTLLNKMDARDFQDSTEFTTIAPMRFQAVASFFKNGFYFKKGDEVKVEDVPASVYPEMVAMLKEHYLNQFQQAIFYDLDSVNISRYEKDFFQTTVHRF